MTTSLHLVASLLLALVTILLAVVASRPARARWRDLRAWEEALSQRPVDWGAVVGGRALPAQPHSSARPVPRPWAPRHASRRKPA